MKTIEKIIQSPTTPLRQDVIWIDISDITSPKIKTYINGSWATIITEESNDLNQGTNNDDITEGNDNP